MFLSESDVRDSHQWFGNLVTMEWWTWLYLNVRLALL
jgi:hypothetical protein